MNICLVYRKKDRKGRAYYRTMRQKDFSTLYHALGYGWFTDLEWVKSLLRGIATVIVVPSFVGRMFDK